MITTAWATLTLHGMTSRIRHWTAPNRGPAAVVETTASGAVWVVYSPATPAARFGSPEARGEVRGEPRASLFEAMDDADAALDRLYPELEGSRDINGEDPDPHRDIDEYY